MIDLGQQLMQQLSSQEIGRIAEQIGAPEAQTRSGLNMALPLLFSALANNASQPQGAQSLHQALVQDHDGSILNNLTGFLGNPGVANGAGIIGHMLGAQQPSAAQGISQNSGLSSNQVMKLLQIVAPLVMGLLGKQQQQNNLDVTGLASFLGGQQQAVQQNSTPDVLGLLGMLTGAGNSGNSGSSNSGSGLGDMLNMVNTVSGLLGKKK
jgi:hypothetical protein